MNRQGFLKIGCLSLLVMAALPWGIDRDVCAQSQAITQRLNADGSAPRTQGRMRSMTNAQRKEAADRLAAARAATFKHAKVNAATDNIVTDNAAATRAANRAAARSAASQKAKGGGR
jgi:hypothetical protein